MSTPTLSRSLTDAYDAARDLGSDLMSSFGRAADRMGVDRRSYSGWLGAMTDAMTGRPSCGCGTDCRCSATGGCSRSCSCGCSGRSTKDCGCAGQAHGSGKDCGCSSHPAGSSQGGVLQEAVSGLLSSMTSGSSGGCGCDGRACHRPDACWLPDRPAAISSAVCPGGKARVCFAVHNCGLSPRDVFLAATGRDAGLATGSPSTASIGALETGRLVAEVSLPEGTECAELILWVRGCHDTAIAWTVTACDNGCNTTHEVRIEDCPQTQHHWYDHFAQPKPCRTGFRNG